MTTGAPCSSRSGGPLPPATASVGLLLVLHAFAAGCTALTGVEAISNGVPAFRRPEARNARRTLVAMGMILGSLFVGVSFLAVHVGVRPFEGGNPTLIGQLAGWVLGGSTTGRAFFYLFQAATLAILVLAANTSYADFPRLASFAAADAFLPRWFTKRGQRLVHSNGIIALSLAAAGAPFGPLPGCLQVADSIIRNGSETLQREILPRVARGDATFWQGYSEPDAGSDLLALKTHARLDGDHWVLDGRKIWSSHAGIATYGTVLARTDPARWQQLADAHGVKLLRLLPADAPMPPEWMASAAAPPSATPGV